MDSIASPTREMPATTGRASRIVLVDGQQIFRHAVRMLFAGDAAFDVIGECGTARAALELADVLHPDVVITELQLSDSEGVDLIEQLRVRQPNVAILVLTTLRARERVAAARRAGALGYLLKECGRAELLSAVRAVSAGRRYRSSALSRRAPRSRVHPGGPHLGAQAAVLTERQRAVLRSLALGYRTREIAQMLGVSVRAIYRQRETLRNTLQLNSTAALTRFAVYEGIAEDCPVER
jgi:two-component system NarL family response regulator